MKRSEGGVGFGRVAATLRGSILDASLPCRRNLDISSGCVVETRLPDVLEFLLLLTLDLANSNFSPFSNVIAM